MRRYSNNRAGRIADQIHKDIVGILRHTVRDPRLNLLTINDVDVDADYAWAKIYWTVYDDTTIVEVTKALESATGFVRSELSKGFKTYTIPQLKFVYDDSMVRGAHILNVLNKVKEQFLPDDIEDIDSNTDDQQK